MTTKTIKSSGWNFQHLKDKISTIYQKQLKTRCRQTSSENADVEPDKRITILDSLKDPFMAKYYDPNNVPTGEPESAYNFDYELSSLQTSEYKELLFNEIKHYHEED